MTIGEKIENARLNRNLTQEELATKLGFLVEDIDDIENGKIIPNDFVISMIGKALNTSFFEGNIDEDRLAIPESDQQESEYILSAKRLKICKIWLIIGATFTPIFSVSSYIENTYDYTLLYIAGLLYLVTIPLCILIIKKITKAKRKQDLNIWGVIALLFVSFIGGIYILTSDKNK